MAIKGRKTANKNPPILSHEFIIQNHADIVACVAMVFVVGLMFAVTSPLASLFIALHHNATVPVQTPAGDTVDITLYTAGVKDLAAVFFYLLIAVVMHQIIQEYVLDKVNRKLHLSKIKHAKFNESGQLLSFYLISLLWAGDIIMRENLFSIRSLWEGYPHTYMSFMFKFFFIVQIAYWVHIYPELYFQRVKKEDMPARIQYATLYLAFVGGAYLFSFTRVGLCLLVLQYVTEAVFHVCRLLSYAEKTALVSPLHKCHDVLFVLARLGSISLAVLTFWYGLALAPKEHQLIDLANGNFNTFFFRLNALMAVCLLQAYLMWNFIMFHMRRRRENAESTGGAAAVGGVVAAVGGGAQRKKTEQQRALARKEAKKPKEGSPDEDDADDNSELPEVDQNARSLRQRK